MARKVSKIFDDVIEALTKDSVLSQLLTSKKKSAFFRLHAYVYAELTSRFEAKWDDFENRVNKSIQNQRVANSFWYQKKALEFQYGYNLVVDQNYQVKYDTIDEDAKIIKSVAVDPSPKRVLIKVAKKDGENPNSLIKLDPNEKNAFDIYMQGVDYAPSYIVTQSEDGDKINIEVKVDLDPQVFNVSTLKPLIDDANDVILNTISEYINTFFDKNFNSKLFASKMSATILSIDGVNNVVFKKLEASKNDGSAKVNILTEASQSYNPFAGFFVNPTIKITNK